MATEDFFEQQALANTEAMNQTTLRREAEKEHWQVRMVTAQRCKTIFNAALARFQIFLEQKQYVWIERNEDHMFNVGNNMPKSAIMEVTGACGKITLDFVLPLGDTFLHMHGTNKRRVEKELGIDLQPTDEDQLFESFKDFFKQLH